MFEPEIKSFARFLRSENKSSNTVRIYTDAAERFSRFLADHAGTDDTPPAGTWDDVTRDHIRAWMVSILDTHAAGYANNQYRALQQFLRWYSAEEGVPNPMAGMSPPMIPEKPMPVLREEELRALLRACEGKDLVSRRDTAIIRFFLGAGVRLEELTKLTVDDVDLDHREALVFGKGRRTRIVVFGHKVAIALDRYLRVRARQPWARDQPELWLASTGRRGHAPMTRSGIRQMIERRGEQAGVKLSPHTLRHTWAHHVKTERRLHDDEIMRLAGWKSRAMLDRYGASAADERARAAGKQATWDDAI